MSWLEIWTPTVCVTPKIKTVMMHRQRRNLYSTPMRHKLNVHRWVCNRFWVITQYMHQNESVPLWCVTKLMQMSVQSVMSYHMVHALEWIWGPMMCHEIDADECSLWILRNMIGGLQIVWIKWLMDMTAGNALSNVPHMWKVSNCSATAHCKTSNDAFMHKMHRTFCWKQQSSS
jgi:hypothetical protein